MLARKSKVFVFVQLSHFAEFDTIILEYFIISLRSFEIFIIIKIVNDTFTKAFSISGLTNVEMKPSNFFNQALF